MQHDRGKIELDAIRVLAGADPVRAKLLACLAMGSPSIASSAYLIKCRVKSHDRLVDKVIDRRDKGNREYSASTATDIVGLRILTLYKSEIPFVVRRFFELIALAQNEAIRLFPGYTLKDCLREVIVYRASQNGDVNDQLIASELRRAGLSVPTSSAPEHSQTSNMDVKIIHKESEYSSIHIVLSCIGVTLDARFHVPLEVQIRTSLEDTWGEIDHSLNYKNKAGRLVQTEESSAHNDIAKENLKSLKRLLDNCTGLADSIYRSIQVLYGESSNITKPKESARSIDTNKLLTLPLNDDIRYTLRDCVARIDAVFDAIYKDNSRLFSNEKTVLGWIDEFNELSNILLSCYNLYREGKSDIPDAEYYLKMERSLCLYWVAYLCDYLLLRGDNDDLRAKGTAALETALSEQFQLEKDARFSTEPILAFRIASALQLRGHREIGLSKYEEAVEKLSGSKLPANHHMRVKIPRHLGVAYWELAERHKKDALGLNNPDLYIRKRRELYLRALEVTLEADQIDVDGATFEPPSTKHDWQSIINANNILEYLACFLNAGGDWKELVARGVSRDRAMVYLERLTAGGVERIERPTVADTIRAMAKIIGNGVLAKAAARRVLVLTGEGNIALGISKDDIAEMRRDAEAELAETDNK